MNERLPHMTPNGMLLDVSASPKKKWGKRYNKHIILIRLDYFPLIKSYFQSITIYKQDVYSAIVYTYQFL